MMMADDQSLKVDLVNDIVIGAIAAPIKRPVSLLWGHQKLDPSLTIRLNPLEHQKLKKKSKESSQRNERISSFKKYTLNNTAIRSEFTTNEYMEGQVFIQNVLRFKKSTVS